MLYKSVAVESDAVVSAEREDLLLVRIFLLGVCYKWMVMWMLR